MALSDKAVQRLAALGVNGDSALRFWADIWHSEGESYFWRFVAREEKAAAEYCRWFPQLQAFAAECRRAFSRFVALRAGESRRQNDALAKSKSRLS